MEQTFEARRQLLRESYQHLGELIRQRMTARVDVPTEEMVRAKIDYQTQWNELRLDEVRLDREQYGRCTQDPSLLALFYGWITPRDLAVQEILKWESLAEIEGFRREFWLDRMRLLGFNRLYVGRIEQFDSVGIVGFWHGTPVLILQEIRGTSFYVSPSERDDYVERRTNERKDKRHADGGIFWRHLGQG